MVKFLTTVGFGFILLVIQSTFAHMVPLDFIVPNGAMAIVLYMGLHDYDSGHGAVISFILGYMMDAFAGSPIGLFTFVSVAVFFVSKVASLRLFLQNVIFETILVFFLVLVAGGVILSIRALFDQDFGGLLSHIKIVVLRSGATAVVAPAVFRVMRVLDQIYARRSPGRKVFRR
jgi:rod shape-determining protein MreD